MGMYMRFLPEKEVDLSWPPRVMEFNIEQQSFRLAKAYRALIGRLTGIWLHDEIDLDPNMVAHISAKLNAVAHDRLRRDAAVFGGIDPFLRFTARNGVPTTWRPFIEWRLACAGRRDVHARLNDQAFEQLARMFKIYSAANSRLVGC